MDRLRIEHIALGGAKVVIAVAAACWVMLACANVIVLAQPQAEPGAEKPVTEAAPEQLGLKPGEPLSSPSLVNTPAKLNGVISWTIDTRRSRGNLRTLDVSHDGKFAATGGEDGTIRIWDLATGALVRALVGHTMYSDSLAWSPDGQTLASTGGYECTLRLWDMQTGKPLRVFKDFKEYTQQVAWSPAGDRLAVVGGDSGWIWIWDKENSKGRLVAEVGKRVSTMNWSPSGDQLAFTVNEGSASIVDATSGKVVQTFGEPSTLHHRACWSPDGTKFLVTSADKSVVYKLPDATPLATLPKSGWGPAWSPDSKSVYLLSPEGTLLWDLAADKVVRNIGSPWNELAWRQPNQLVSMNQTTLACWEPRTGKRLAEYYIGGSEPPLWTSGRPIVTGLGTQRLWVWDATTAVLMRTYKGHTDAITAAAWSPNGELLASASVDKTVRIWEADSDKLRATLVDHHAPVHCLVWSPDGKTLATGGEDNMVRLWNASGELQATLAGHTKPVKALDWAPRGDLLASGGEGGLIRIWDGKKSKFEREIRVSEELEALAFHPTGTILAGAAADELVRLWLVATGKPIIKNLRGGPGTPPTATALAWSPDGRYLLVGRLVNLIQMWDWRRAEVSDYFYTMGSVKYVGFFPEGRYIFGGSDDRSVRIWDRIKSVPMGHILDQGRHVILLNGAGHYCIDPARQPDIVYVVQTDSEQLTLKPAEFAERFGWKNEPEKVRLPGK